MEFRVLGPLEVSADGRPLPLGGPKQRAILALLVLSANEIVARERLIDDVWGDEPPAEVDATIRVYVARLRKLLAAGDGDAPTLEAYRNGYVLRIAPETVDLKRFEDLLASGAEALAAGRAAQASAELKEALGLWRGPALVDLSGETWVRREAARLEDRRLRALEERIDADLALGLHAEVVAELESLVAANPARERFVEQLMLALYRCGRQQAALQAYTDVRRRLREEFGLEPSRALRELERRILVQDVTLDAAAAAIAEPASVRPRRRRRALVAAAATVAVAAGAVAAAALRDRAASPVALEGNSVVVIDPQTNAVVEEVPVGGRPSGIALGFASVWVGNVDDKTLLRIDPDTREVVETIGLGAEPRAIAVGGGSVWVLSRAANAIFEVDPVSNDVVASIELLAPNSLAVVLQIAFGRGAVWVTSSPPPGTLFRIDPKTHSPVVHLRNVSSITSSGRALWGVVGWQMDRVRRLDPPGETIRFERLGSVSGLGGVVANDRAVWTGTGLGHAGDATLWRIDPDLSRVTASIPLRHPIGSIDLGERAMWIVTRDRYVLRVDPEAGRVVKTIALGLYGTGTIAAGEGAIWVATLER